MPVRVKKKLEDNEAEDVPILSELEVFNKFEKRKLKSSTTPGDIPPRIKKEFSPWIATPAADLFNSITTSGTYPEEWKTEFVTPINKIPSPETEDDLRPISILPDLSRDYNSFIVDWLLPIIKERMDPAQLGGIKGCSVSHYLILLYNFLMSRINTSSNEPKSIILALIDFQKGFTKIDHNKILIRLSDWNTSGWLLRIISSYLTNRMMVVRYGGAESEPQPLPSGGPQGDTLTMILFLVLVSDSAMDPAPPLPPHAAVDGDVNCVPAPPPGMETEEEIRLKYQDNLSLGEVIDLKTKLTQRSAFIGPKNFHERNGLELPSQSSKIQQRLNDLHKYVTDHNMKINIKKSKIFPVNFTRKYDFIPELSFNNNELEVTYSTKLLGVIWTSNCEWDENTKYLTNKANSRLYFLRRLKALGAKGDTLKEVYILFIRSILEYCAPLWAGNLSKKAVKALTRVEKNAFKIIFPQKTYDEAASTLEIKLLSQRRLFLAQKCAKTMSQHEKFKYLFKKKYGPNTRSNCKFQVPKSRTNRMKYSPISVFSKLMNGQTENVFRN